MPKESNKCKYLSELSPEPNYITEAQYIVEQICIKKAKYDGRELPYRPWIHPKWEKFYRQQIPAANALLRTYHPADIIATLRDYRTNKTYSLRAPWLIPIIKQKQKEREAKPKVTHIQTEEKELTKPQKQHGKKSIISKLRGSNGKEETKE